MGMTKAFRESTTLKMVLPAWLILLFKFLSGGLDFGFGSFPVLTAVEFASAFAAVMAVWLGREWRKAHYET